MHIRSADAAGLYLDQHILRPYLRYRPFLYPQIVPSIKYRAFHRFFLPSKAPFASGALFLHSRLPAGKKQEAGNFSCLQLFAELRPCSFGELFAISVEFPIKADYNRDICLPDAGYLQLTGLFLRQKRWAHPTLFVGSVPAC